MNMDEKELIKQNKFRRLVNLRTNRLLKDIKLISNLADKRHYSYSDGEIKYLRKVINDELTRTFQKFENRYKKRDSFNIERSES